MFIPYTLEIPHRKNHGYTQRLSISTSFSKKKIETIQMLTKLVIKHPNNGVI